MKKTKNLIVVEKVLPDRSGFIVNAPPGVSQEKIGFTDSIIDTDGKQRRNLLVTANLQNKWRFSFSLQLVKHYLSKKGIEPDNVIDDPYSIRFASTKIRRIHPNSGGYVRADTGGSQILINFRNRQNPFNIVSLDDIYKGTVESDRISGKIVLIGMMTSSVKDYANSSATNIENPALNYGVEMQAHMVSQITSAVLDGRPMLNVWSDVWEYVWIVAWGILGISLGRIIHSPWKILLLVLFASFCLIGICYGLLVIGWWIPVVPAFLALVLNGSVLASFERYDEALRSRIKDRQLVIDHIFDTIHSQPLQTLSITLRKIQSKEGLAPQQFLSEMQQLNQELRSVYELVKKEALTEVSSLHLGKEQQLNLQQPLHEILHEIYNEVVDRDYPCFKTVKIKVVKFEQMDERKLTLEHKRSLCRFLEEALHNVGKYAQGTTKLEVICIQESGVNTIRVVDNGSGINAIANISYAGFGTQQAQNLAKQLGGQFERFPNSPKGIVCQITWSPAKLWSWRF
ncbi:CHASE2 domain-containing protein [Scytonema sp. UIC 10036]|uniref:sensor histidine kinase n=1 Tax=Scytonema sp. UIC 10036 TaxID=2304196 RepID=UPI00140F5CDA|nr:CHASE2 domain-containing protein [Scytonema sp. UIC 10036]